jgi:polysaccharide export outer membrane protein
LPEDLARQPDGTELSHPPAGSAASSASLLQLLVKRAPLAGSIVGALLTLCLLYCLIAPNQYDAVARVELRTAPLSALHMEGAEPLLSTSILSAPMAQETAASILRSDLLAWDTIKLLRLYDSPAFAWNFAGRFPGFQPGDPSREARAWLVERFHQQLQVQSVPHTLLIEVRFRSKDPALSADAVKMLLDCYELEEGVRRVDATRQSSRWLGEQLGQLQRATLDADNRLNQFREQHSYLSMPSTNPVRTEGESQHNPVLLEMDELGRQLVAVRADRILAEAEYHAAQEGDPELVVASDPRLQMAASDFPVAVLQQIHARRSELEQERAQLSAEHGANFPRVVEIDHQLQDLTQQQKAEDARLVECFHRAWQTAQARERSVQQSLDNATAQGVKLNRAATEYARMQQEADANHALVLRVQQKSQEAGLTAGISNSTLAVVDPAYPPAKPASPDYLVAMPITLFVSLWIAMAAVLAAEKLNLRWLRLAALLLLATGFLQAQAPPPALPELPKGVLPVAPSTQMLPPPPPGLPTGMVHRTPTQDNRTVPDPRQAPAVWNAPIAQGGAAQAGGIGAPMTAAIGPNDALDISEYHTPEFHSAVRVSAAGNVTLPLIEQIYLAGMDEQQAAHAIEAALKAKGMLLHPLVSVQVTSYAGQDVSVLGEVARPGVYPFTLHHRLLDLLSAAAGLSPSAGRLVNVYHRNDPRTPHPVVLDPGGTDTATEHNPELDPGDTIQVSRAGLIYVIGDVIRPGGFPVDPAQGLTVVQALSLAWGPSQNAAARRAILIREQKGGRTLTTLNLSRMLRGQEPDQPVHDRDILFVPDSTAHTLLNHTLESAIQSAVGITIYSGLVYSQRY